MNQSTAALHTSFGSALRAWRRARGETQLSLALRAGISARHLSFIETGRSSPSREMVLLLGEALDLPLRERNKLLGAAGFASVFRETDLNGPELAQVRRVLAFLLERHEPYPALVVNGRYDVVMRNEASVRVFSPFVADAAAFSTEPLNLLRVVCSDAGIRNHLVNGQHVAAAMLERAEQATGEPAARILSDLGIERAPERQAPSPPDADGLLLPLHLKNGELELRLLSTFTILGGARDVTLQEMQIECFLAADEASDEILNRLAKGESA